MGSEKEISYPKRNKLLQQFLTIVALRVVRHGLPVAETLHDIGVSAFRGDNAQTGELGRFVQRIENGEIPPGSVIVAESLDRLTRKRVN